MVYKSSEVDSLKDDIRVALSDSGLIGRRRALAFGLYGCAVLLSACGGSNEDTAQPASADEPTPAPAPSPAPTPAPTPAPSPAPAPAQWNVGPLFFAAGTATKLELSTTLPSGVRKGGTFGVSPSGMPLPAGMTLSSAGLLSLGTALVGTTTGVVFTYSEPA